MTVLLKIACQTISRRLAAGEAFDAVISDYPKLTADQIAEIKEALNIT